MFILGRHQSTHAARNMMVLDVLDAGTQSQIRSRYLLPTPSGNTVRIVSSRPTGKGYVKHVVNSIGVLGGHHGMKPAVLRKMVCELSLETM
eukprot:2868843-Karenia_brevis.AAC.1